MSFAEPKFLWLLVLVLPLLGLFLWWSWRRRQQLIAEFVRNKLLAELTVGVSAGRQKARRILLVFAVSLLLLALARPQWGFTWEEATLRSRDILVAIDTSRSMMAQDMQPNRLARAKLAAMDLLQLAKFDRLGLVAFAGTAFLQCPLTLDDEAFRQSVAILEPGIIPQGGSALGEAIRTARESFSKGEGDNHRIIVLFTDGEDHEEGVLDQARLAASEGVRIFTIGVGTAAGELLRVPDQSGRMVFLKDNYGNAVKSRLNESLLQQIARAADGFYLPLQGGDAMQVLYEKGLAPLPTSERSTKLMKKFREQYHWPLAAAILLLVMEIFLPDRRKVTPRPAAASPWGMAALVAFLLCAPGLEGSSASALRKYRAGEYREALGQYRDLAQNEPGDPRLQYNAGAAAFQAGELDFALSKFQAAAASPDLDIQQRSFYNMGNTLFRLGAQNPNVQERMQSWQDAIAAYEAALKLNAQDADAQFNLEFVKKKLEELQHQQEQQKQQQNNQDQEKKEEKEQQDNSQPQKQDNQEQQEQNNSEQQQQQEQQSQDQQNRDQEQEQEEQPEQQQQQDRAGNQQQEQEQQQQRAGSDKDQPQSGQNPESGEEGQFAQMGQMTPAQARQLLDAQKGEEKALLFIPEAKRSRPRTREFKDW